MQLNLSPVKVDITIETPTVTNNSFYNVCFITENNEAPRTVEINSLADLLTNGYKTTDAVYNFCFYVFLQNGMSKVYVRNKRSDETYEQAFDADDNSNYYYCVIESKDISKILTFNTHLNTVDKYKLQFFSSKECVSDLIQGRKIVFYYDETLPTEKHTLYASRPYPTLIEKEDAYQPTVTPLDITLKDILKQGYGEDAYQPTIKPLDITMRDIVLSKQVDDKDAYQPTIKPLDITLKSIVKSSNVDDKDAYQPTIKPLDITLKRVVVSSNVDDKDAYQPTIKPLDITLNTV